MKTFIKHSLALAILPAFILGCQSHDTTHARTTPTTKSLTSSIASAPTTKSLAGYDWRLIKTDDKAIAPFLATTTLSFKDDQLAFSVGCNRHLGSFSLDGSLLALDKTSLSITRKACESSLHQAENALTSSLTSAQLEFVADDKDANQAILTISSQGKTSMWQGVKKPELLYGKPVTLFWEIDAKPVMCADNTKQCLKIRNVRYDNYGVKIGAGAWQHFDGQIKGYEHDKGLNQIIRLKAYGNTATHDTPVYIYDGVVESSLAQ